MIRWSGCDLHRMIHTDLDVAKLDLRVVGGPEVESQLRPDW
jgi:metal-sulfur cluster biosynthetic enzyme